MEHVAQAVDLKSFFHNQMNMISEIDDHCRQIEDDLNQFKRQGKKLFLSSSLQTHSLPLLDIIHSIDPKIPVYFIDTGYHFPETILFKDRLKKEYGYHIIELSSPVNRYQQKDSDGQLLYTSDPDYCCYINKVLPLEPILKEYDVWISGVRASQSAFRSDFGKVGKGTFDTIKYHPVLEWTNQMIYAYKNAKNLPEHPLDEQGYSSIGCLPCTRKAEIGMDPREMRWFGLNKTECGLHTETMDTK